MAVVLSQAWHCTDRRLPTCVKSTVANGNAGQAHDRDNKELSTVTSSLETGGGPGYANPLMSGDASGSTLLRAGGGSLIFSTPSVRRVGPIH